MKKVQSPQEVPANTLPGVSKPEKNLFIKVDTLSVDGKNIGERIVDMYHFGTRNWVQSHLWWAMHNAATVETRPATPDEVSAYVAEQKAALVAKFAPDVAHAAV